ncbi:MAG: DUF6448 family protein [Sphingomonadaceae bacterium]
MLHLTRKALRLKLGALTFALAIGVTALAFAPAPSAEAHCDSVNGPVVAAAQKALEANDVDLVLPYVQPESEAELSAVFQHTQEVRRLGGEAQKLAERFFYETAVRLHRHGEGAAYTGLKTESDFGPALTAADKALETGSLDETYALLDRAVKDGIAEKFHAVAEARELAAKEGSVAANREKVEAELLFQKYVLALFEAAEGNAVHGEGAPAEGGHTTGEGQVAPAHTH